MMEPFVILAAFLLGIIVDRLMIQKQHDRRKQWQPLNTRGERLRLFR